jgi:hypothetical protein
VSPFSADWLALREPLDAKSRADSLGSILLKLLASAAPRKQSLEIIDLGAGTGANVRYLAPLLGGSQHWLLVERDPLLLAALRGRMQAWAQSRGWHIIESGDHCAIHGSPFECSVRSVALDLAQLDQLLLTKDTLVSASALLDLVSERWLRDLAERTARAGATVWFALSYDGRLECRPAEPEDADIRELFNAHQLTDKGFGPALGPRAAAMAEQVFAAHGYRIWCAPSDWRIGPDQAALQRAVLQGWCDAACEMAAARAVALRSWLARRLRHVQAGRSELLIGHTDMLGHRT